MGKFKVKWREANEQIDKYVDREMTVEADNVGDAIMRVMTEVLRVKVVEVDENGKQD